MSENDQRHDDDSVDPSGSREERESGFSEDAPQEAGFHFPGLNERFSDEELLRFSALQLIDFLLTRHQFGKINHADLELLRDRVAELEETHDEARETLEKLNEIVEKLSAPALRIGTFLNRLENGNLLVCVNGTDYVCSVSPEVPEAGLESGTRVLLNEALAVTDIFGFDRGGPVVKISDTLPDGRLRIAQEGGLNDGVVQRSTLLAKEKLRPGLEVRLDPSRRVATEIIQNTRQVKRSLTTVEEVPWHNVGGQEEAVEAIRDSIELPHIYPELFEKFNHPVPKGILLYGPPGCGKTLLGKATAYNLRRQLHERTGEDHPEFFLHVKGPEILNMWLGESERQVRELFSQCREKAAEGHLSFLFIDEAESILGTRMGGRLSHNIVSTLVPMFCTEMDGIEPLQNVIVILASNRADLIDPAILRPGRVDRKIRVTRPGKDAAREIYRIYLHENLPLAEDRDKLINAVTDAHYAETEETRFLEIVFRSGRREFLHRGHLSSGALIAAVVERAKSYAIKRSVSEKGELSPIQREDLLRALKTEYAENELFPPNDVTEDWLKLTDFDADNVVKLTPFRPGKNRAKSQAI